MKDPRAMPKPGGGWSSALREIPGALVLPTPPQAKLSFPGGVLDAAGAEVTEAANWRGPRRITLPPETAPAQERLEGTWLWGGLLYGHFGHFMCESTGRLWALDQAEAAGAQGVLFITRIRDAAQGAARWHHDYLRLMGTDLPLRLVTVPTAVQRLIVPGQGFGLGPISEGTAPMRAAMAARFAASVAPDGPERLYISRSGVGPRRGGLLFEDRLEAHLAAEGYEVFHPQDHDLATQVARYKAARQILGAEGSALHLLGMVARADQQVGVILRRRSGATDNILRHLTAFSGRAPALIEAIRRVWMPAAGGRPHVGLGELDMPRLGAALQAGGFVEDGAWPDISDAEARAAVQAKRYWKVNGYRPTA